jgi:hypothetical protein
VSYIESAFITDAQRTAAVGQRDHQQRSTAVACLALAAAVVATMAFGFHKSSATSVVPMAASKPMSSAPALLPTAAMPVARLDTVVIRPTAQQLAEVELLRKARLARSGPAVPGSVIAGAVTTGAGL